MAPPVLVLGRAAVPDLTAALTDLPHPPDVLLAEDRTAMLRHLTVAGAVVADWSGRLVLDAAAARAGGRVRLVQYPGAGLHSIDVDAWRRAGAEVCHLPGANAASVAEWSVLAAGALCRRLPGLDHDLRAGRWTSGADVRDLSERRVGVLGGGAVGTACLRLFAAFGCPVSYHSRRPRPEVPYEWRPLDDLLAGSEVLVVAVPLTPATRGLLGAGEIARLPADALLVNVGRGPVTDEDAVADALRTGRLGGAALDVFGVEPLPADHPLRAAPHTLLSPHVAGGSGTARRHIFAGVADNLARVADGREPRWRWPTPNPPKAGHDD